MLNCVSGLVVVWVARGLICALLTGRKASGVPGELVRPVLSWVGQLPAGGLLVGQMSGEFICPILNGIRVLLVQEPSWGLFALC